MQRAQQQQGGQPQGGQPQDAETPQDQAQPGDTGEDQQYSLGNGQFDSNPFTSLMAQGQSGAGQPQSAPQSPDASQGGFQQVPQGMEQAAMMGGVQNPDDQLQKGQGAGSSKFLLGAAQQLQGYISESQNRDEIAIARSILQLLTKLIDRDQENLSAKLDQAPQAPDQSQGGGMGAMMGAMAGGAQGGLPGAATGQ